jgi:RNA polymerase sigma-70 factor (ECF subfamily)
MPQLGDEPLVRLIQQQGPGWKLAADVLLGRHRQAVVAHCVSRLHHQQDAQDVTQRILLRALVALGRFEGRSAFRTWLYTITENECRTFLVQRARYVQTEHIERLVELFETGAMTESETLAEQDAVAVALGHVSSEARQVLHLRFFEDRSLEEIAAVLAISLSAAKMRLYRALDQFSLHYRVQVQPA